MTDMVKELLENNTLTQEIAEALDVKIMGMVTPLRNDLKTLRDEKNTLSKSFDEVVKSKGDLDEQLKGIDEKIKQAKKDGQSDLVKQLEDEKSSKDELQKSLDNLQKANMTLRVDGSVSQELDKYDVKAEDKEMVHFFLRSKSFMTDDGTRFKDGESELKLDEAFKVYFEKNGSRLNATNNGNGSGTENGGSGVNGNKKYFDKTSSEFSLTKQGEIFKKDPALYKQLKG